MGKKFNLNPENLPRLLFIVSLCVTSFLYGGVTYQYQTFPYTLMEDAVRGAALLIRTVDSYALRSYYRPTEHSVTIPIYNETAAYKSLSLVTGVSKDDFLFAQVIDMDGRAIHTWQLDWFEIWPNASHIPAADQPKSRPGTNVHGAILVENGDLIFNFDGYGLVRLDVCGNVVWRLPYRTHHSIYQDEYDILWVSGQINHTEALPDFPNYQPPFIEPTILRVTLEGEILTEISIMDVLKHNNLHGLMLMSSLALGDTSVSGDTFHSNDVETFPSSMAEGVFKAGDIMVSLRNINTVLVFQEADWKIRYLTVGGFTRQHDPDFIDGNTISIFDNNNIAPASYGQQSRIIIQSPLKNNHTEVYYTGTEAQPFYTATMGKHEWLPNGNLLITDSANGRAFEVDENGNIVWEFINLVAEGFVGRLSEVHRLPPNISPELFAEQLQQCHN